MRGIGYLSLEIARNHGQGTAGQVAKSIRQIGVVALHQRVEAKRSILTENDFAQKKIAEGVGAERINDGFGAHDISARLRHLAFFKQQPAVRGDAFG